MLLVDCKLQAGADDWSTSRRAHPIRAPVVMAAHKACHTVLAFTTYLLLCIRINGLLVEPTSTKTPPSSKAPIVIHPPPNHTPYQLLLSIEAGGLKGVLQTYLLQQVRDAIKDAMVDHGYVSDALSANDFDIDIADWFPTMAGTSIGAVQALYYATKGGAALARTLAQAQNVRPGSPEAALLFFDLLAQMEGAQTLLNANGNATDAAQLLAAARANTDATRRLLQTIFGNTTLNDLTNTSVYITTTDPIARAPLDVFRWAPTNTSGWLQYVVNSSAPSAPALQPWPGVNFQVADVALASSAAVPQTLPVQLASLPGGNVSSRLNKTVVDGAFATNNPAAAAVAWMLQRTPRQDVVVLSIGNGDATFAVDGPEAVYQSLLSSPVRFANLISEAGVQKAAHAAAEAMLVQADSDPDGADSDGPPRLLRLDFLASLRDGEDSPVPGLTAADLVEALESGYANDADTYEAVGRYADAIDEFVRTYAVPPLASAPAMAPEGRSRR